MWPFEKKKSIARCGILHGFTDWHSHLLPGVDDGVQTFDETLAILSQYEQLGIENVWLTPHIMEDRPNTTGNLRDSFDELKSKYQGKVQLRLASENMLDNLFEERLESNDLLPIGENGNHLLVETSYFNPPIDLYGIIKRIKSKGYYPLLAHPERYAYMTDEDYRQLKDMGVKLQLNLFSLTGTYGTTARKRALMMISRNYYDVIGTDIHSQNILLDLNTRITIPNLAEALKCTIR